MSKSLTTYLTESPDPPASARSVESSGQICFAVFRLITNLNFIGYSTGRSAGLAAVKFLSSGHQHGDTGKIVS